MINNSNNNYNNSSSSGGSNNDNNKIIWFSQKKVATSQKKSQYQKESQYHTSLPNTADSEKKDLLLTTVPFPRKTYFDTPLGRWHCNYSLPRKTLLI